MNSLLLNVFDLVITIAMLLIFIRFMLQFAGIDAWDPVAMPAYKATRIVDVFGRIFPTVADGRISIAAIVLMLLIRLIDISGTAALTHHGIGPLHLFAAGLLSLIYDFLRISRYLVIGSIIVSWIVVLTNNMHPLLGLIVRLAEPILAPFRRFVPNLGMLDLSPIIAFFVLILAQNAVGISMVNTLPPNVLKILGLL